ncbi:type VII secretion protein EsaA [Cellulomonas sp. NPDC058312]|uniref:type VII secretion protein EsaA n=1 Tax=Cellulomonas sp. NPDC058312 TaxID=3346441 RepID=UPI0036E0BA4F
MVLVVASVAALLLTVHGGPGARTDDAATAGTVVLDVGLVNEDRGVDTGGEQVNLGRGYVRQIESDTSAAWHVVSRGVAERALAHGSYHLLVIIPTDFSAKLLDLASPDPDPIGITYQANGAGDARLEAVAERRGQEIVEQLSGQLVDVYVASILGNLRRAQDDIQVVVAAEAQHAGVLAEEVDPAARALGTGLGGLTQDADGSLAANGGLVDALGGHADGLDEVAGEHDAHDVTLAGLVAQRQEGALSHAAFLEAALAMDARLLGAEVQGMHDGLDATGRALAAQLEDEGDPANHAAAVAGLDALVREVEASVTDRVGALAALDAAAVLSTHAPGVRAGLDGDGDGAVTLAEVLARSAAGHAEPPTAEPALAAVLRAAVAAQVAVLPYRDADALAEAVDAGVLDRAGTAVADLAGQIGADLATVLDWEGHADVPVDPDRVVGADLADLGAALGGEVVGPPDGLESGPGAEPGRTDTAGGPEDPQVAHARAALYGARVAQVADAYRRAADLVRLVAACAQDCGLAPGTDVTAAVDAVLLDAVARQVAAEREHLTAAQGLTERLQSSAAALTEGRDRLRATSRGLAAQVDAHLDQLTGLRAVSAGVVAAERPVAQSTATVDATTRDLLAEASTLTASSALLAADARSGADQAAALGDLLDLLRADVARLGEDSADLDGRSAALTTALTAQVAGSQEFADAFAGVLPHAHSAGVLNERLLRFLVEPVEPTPRAAVAAVDVGRPLPWVLIAFSLCFLAAYLVAHVGTGRSREVSGFDRARTAWFRANARAAGWCALAGVALGAALAVVSAVDLGVPRETQVAWVTAVVLICCGLTLLSHWLVAQCRALGVGLCVVLLVGHVLVTDAVGSGAPSGAAGVLAAVNPLGRAESALGSLLGTDPAGLVVAGPLVVGVLAVLLLDLVVVDPARLVPRRWRAVPA